MNKLKQHAQTILSVILILSLGALGYLGYEHYDLRGEHAALLSKHELLITDFNNQRTENEGLTQLLEEKESIISSFQGEINSIGRVVGDLQKLKNTDEELLKKYSKVYFLNENYIPKQLTQVSDGYSFYKDRDMYVLAEVWPYLERLFDAAGRDDVDLLVASAYRDFQTQAALKDGYTVIYGAGTANQFSADQGYSEHQLGTTLDFTTQEVGAYFSLFEATPAFKWLVDNAHKYGFILSYPKGNTYYKYEPWHWRFVGVELATHLHEEGKNFYDLDQREIDTYLIKIFD